MRIDREDSRDLGAARSALSFGVIDRDELSQWAMRAIEEEDDPPTFLYTMLDMSEVRGDELDREIGFIAGMNLDGDDEFQYLREIGVRRGINDYAYLGWKPKVVLAPHRKKYIDDLLMHNFGIDVDALPPLSDFEPDED